MRFCCCPFAFPAKYHPWIYILIFCIINPPGSVSMVAGFIVGYLYVFKALAWFQISDAMAHSLEESFLFACCSDHSTFIKVNEATKNEIAISAGLGLNMGSYNRQQNDALVRGPSAGQVIGGPSSGRNNYRAFAGQGVRLGATERV